MADDMLQLAESIGMGRAPREVTQRLVGDVLIEKLCPHDSVGDAYLRSENLGPPAPSSSSSSSSSLSSPASPAPCEDADVPRSSCGGSVETLDSASSFWADQLWADPTYLE